MPSPGLYVHVPFCRTKCPYCDFASQIDLSTLPDTCQAVLVEAAEQAPSFGTFDTLYLGGGTPSLLSIEQLQALLGGLAPLLAEGAEVTLEMNPDDASLEWLVAARRFGVNRLSLGTQSFDDGCLALLGRRHTAQQNLESVELARQAGYHNLSLDLMFGLPDQTPADWRVDLQAALDLYPAHLSCYQLTYHAETPFGRRRHRGDLVEADDELARELFLMTSRVLRDHGYEHYEISNFALPGRRSRHNQKYWRRHPYLGLGPAAHSHLAERRWWNVASVSQYLGGIRYRGRAIEEDEVLSEEQQLLESLDLGLRTADGVETSLILGMTGGEERLAELVERGWLRRRGERVEPTFEGMLVADRLALACFE